LAGGCDQIPFRALFKAICHNQTGSTTRSNHRCSLYQLRPIILIIIDVHVRYQFSGSSRFMVRIGSLYNLYYIGINFSSVHQLPAQQLGGHIGYLGLRGGGGQGKCGCRGSRIRGGDREFIPCILLQFIDPGQRPLNQSIDVRNFSGAVQHRIFAGYFRAGGNTAGNQEQTNIRIRGPFTFSAYLLLRCSFFLSGTSLLCTGINPFLAAPPGADCINLAFL